jgi:UDP-N-acetylglucosamine--N-acetylmuramyl-(pentapeptide) pyrophosphoryl-undecaprenol N-acetylglucosamine transferase
VYPGLAVLDSLRELAHAAGRDLEVVWIGGNGMEESIVRSRGIDYRRIPTGKLRRYLSFRNLVDLFRVVGGVLAAAAAYRKFRPAVVFSKGGFVSVPAVIAARLRRIPVISHESDADPGLATRINTRFSERIVVAYDSVRAHFAEPIRDRVLALGNPLRSEVFSGDRSTAFGIAGFDADDTRPVILVLGGSQGAVQLNQLIFALRDELEEGWRIIHQCGAATTPPEPTASYFCRQYFESELPHLLAAADLVVCRAGASTLWEAAATGSALVMVPLIAGSRGDQVRNARLFADAGAGTVVEAAGTGPDAVSALRDAIAEYSEPERRAEAGRDARAFAEPGAATKIARLVFDRATQGEK